MVSGAAADDVDAVDAADSVLVQSQLGQIDLAVL